MKNLVRSKPLKRLAVGLSVVCIVLSFMLLPASTETAQAGQCYQLGVYTTRTGAKNKPTVMLYWGKSGHPDANRIVLYFDNHRVPTPSNYGVNTHYPQYDSGGWIGYYIATRWILGFYDGHTHLLWDQDWRWKAYYC